MMSVKAESVKPDYPTFQFAQGENQVVYQVPSSFFPQVQAGAYTEPRIKKVRINYFI